MCRGSGWDYTRWSFSFFDSYPLAVKQLQSPSAAESPGQNLVFEDRMQDTPSIMSSCECEGAVAKVSICSVVCAGLEGDFETEDLVGSAGNNCATGD